MDRGKAVTIGGLLLYCLAILLPPLIYGYIYSNASDDVAMYYMVILDGMKAGDTMHYSFMVPFILLCSPIVWISNSFGWSINVLFLWFVYAMMAMTGIVIYLVFSRLVGRTSGWLALVLSIFCAQGLLFQYHLGQIFNAVNIGLVFVLLLYFSVRYLADGKKYQLALAIIFGALFSSFHLSGIYLPFIAGLATVVYVVYCVARGQRLQKRYLWFGVGLTLAPAVVFAVAARDWLFNLAGAVQFAGRGLGAPLWSYLINFFSATVLVLAVFVVIFRTEAFRNYTREARFLSVLLGCSAIVLAASAFTGVSLDAFRQGLDFATVTALLVAVPVSMVICKNKSRLVIIAVLVVVGFGVFRSFPLWLDYSSAVRPADKEAIAYVNSLDAHSYNCSPQVAYWIYDRFTDAKYSVDADEVLIVRDAPMTPKSDIENIYYKPHGMEPDDSYVLAESFDDGVVIVRVYRKG